VKWSAACCAVVPSCGANPEEIKTQLTQTRTPKLFPKQPTSAQRMQQTHITILQHMQQQQQHFILSII
jgi:hypothetical protein